MIKKIPKKEIFVLMQITLMLLMFSAVTDQQESAISPLQPDDIYNPEPVVCETPPPGSGNPCLYPPGYGPIPVE